MDKDEDKIEEKPAPYSAPAIAWGTAATALAILAIGVISFTYWPLIALCALGAAYSAKRTVEVSAEHKAEKANFVAKQEMEKQREVEREHQLELAKINAAANKQQTPLPADIIPPSSLQEQLDLKTAETRLALAQAELEKAKQPPQQPSSPTATPTVITPAQTPQAQKTNCAEKPQINLNISNTNDSYKLTNPNIKIADNIQDNSKLSWGNKEDVKALNALKPQEITI